MPLSPAPDVLVVGGGIAGLTAALALGDAGRVVLVLDERRPGAASRASAGMLGASLGFDAATARQAAAARDRYPALVARLLEDTGIAVPLDRSGIVEVGDDGEPVALHPLDGFVDAPPLMDALTTAAIRHPRVSLTADAVARIGASGGGGFVATEAGDRHEARHVVVATGAWASQVAGLPRALPVRPLRGELLTLAAAPPPRAMYGCGGYLIPRGGEVLVGATSVDDGFAPRTTPEGRAALLRIADRLAGLAEAPVTAHWSGLRPMSPDALPILGVDPAHPWLAYAAGLSRNGILFAPWAADQLAAELDGARVTALDPFRVARFG